MAEENLKKSDHPIFEDVKYKSTGMVPLSIIELLQNNGASSSFLLSIFTTHCIAGEDACSNEVDEATNLYLIPVVTPEWVTLSLKCLAKLPIHPFLYEKESLFSSVTVCLSQLKRSDVLRLWSLITFYGGKFVPTLHRNVTHLVVGRAQGAKYNHLMKMSGCQIQIVTPDWVTSSVKCGSLLDEKNFHPKLLISEPDDCNTSFITGFADDCVIGQSAPVASGDILDELKLRMPWNIIDCGLTDNNNTSEIFNLCKGGESKTADASQMVSSDDGSEAKNPGQLITGSNVLDEGMISNDLNTTADQLSTEITSMEWYENNPADTAEPDAVIQETNNFNFNKSLYSMYVKHLEELKEMFKKEKMWLVLHSKLLPTTCKYLESLALLEQKQLSEMKMCEKILDSTLTSTWSSDDWLDLKNSHSLLYSKHFEEINNLTKYKDEVSFSKERDHEEICKPDYCLLPPAQHIANPDAEMVSPARPQRRLIVRLDSETRAKLNSLSPDQRDQFLRNLQRQQQDSRSSSIKNYQLSSKVVLPATGNHKASVNPRLYRSLWNQIKPSHQTRPEILKSLSSNAVVGSKYISTSTCIPATPQKVFKTCPSKSSSSEYVVHETDIDIPKDMFLVDCVFLIIEYTNSQIIWSKLIVGFGGEYVSEYCERVTHIVAPSQAHPLVQRGLREGKRCVSGHWLSETLSTQIQRPPCMATHFPVRFSEKPAKHLSISYSGFDGSDRVRIKQMIQDIGAKPTAVYTSFNDVLVCKSAQGEKYEKAIEWDRTVVNVNWLNDMLLGNPPDMEVTRSDPKYRQFNLANPLLVDHSLIQHLMVSWRRGIKVLPEDLNPAFKEIAESPQVKKRKVLNYPAVIISA